MEISKEILFEEHAAVYEQITYAIATALNISLDEVELVHRNKIAPAHFHMLKFKSATGQFGGIIIADDYVATIPQWPPPNHITDDIKAVLSLHLTARV